jgi:hypothetical protein
LSVAAVYVAGMLALAQDARRYVLGEWEARTGQRPRALMVGPMPIVPWSREVIVDEGDMYRIGLYSAWPRGLELSQEVTPKNDRLAAVALVRGEPQVAGFLAWSRFPYWEVMPAPEGTIVTVRDMRFRARGAVTFMGTATIPAAASE